MRVETCKALISDHIYLDNVFLSIFLKKVLIKAGKVRGR